MIDAPTFIVVTPELLKQVAADAAEIALARAASANRPASDEPLAGSPAVLKVKELAAGARISERTITRAIASGQLTAIHPGGVVRIARKEAIRWLASR